MLHRDIKPGNVFVGKYGETLMIDWGLAKSTGHCEPGSPGDERTLRPLSASGSAETLPGAALGTPAYMSPEQAAGDLDRLGPRSDVYGLGATPFSLLTGQPPIAPGDPIATLRAAQEGNIRSPRSLDPSIDRALEAVCLKALGKRPEDRYPTARALADDVERWLADEPVTAWREPVIRRLRRWARRHRTAVTGAAASLLAGVIGLAAVAGVLAWANDRLTKANNETNKALAETTEAKSATDAALIKSEKEREKAVAVSQLLVESFRKPDPSQDGRELKVVDLLDGALSRLNTGYSGSPAIKGELCSTPWVIPISGWACPCAPWRS